MIILELCHFSSGICGVWNRVREEAFRLSEEGHDVVVFSSNAVKGSEEIAKPKERIGKVLIKRFPYKKLGGESFMNWKFKKETFNFKPDVIIAHSYRQLHTTKALKIGKKIGAKVFLVTHAPFVEGDITRSFFAKLFVRFYDRFIGPSSLKKFDKIIAITKWEIPYLERLGVIRNKIEYIPNGIPEEFFDFESGKIEDKILFLGRVSPIKHLEVLIEAISLIKNREIKLEIVGPAEENYLRKLKNIVKDKKLDNRMIFSEAIFNIKDKIKKIDSARIFVLPSKSEAMPQALIEAMARGKIVIASDNHGAMDLIEDGKNGYLFRIGDFKELAKKIDFALSESAGIGANARESVGKFNWGEVIKKIEELLG